MHPRFGMPAGPPASACMHPLISMHAHPRPHACTLAVECMHPLMGMHAPPHPHACTRNHTPTPAYDATVAGCTAINCSWVYCHCGPLCTPACMHPRICMHAPSHQHACAPASTCMDTRFGMHAPTHWHAAPHPHACTRNHTPTHLLVLLLCCCC